MVPYSLSGTRTPIPIVSHPSRENQTLPGQGGGTGTVGTDLFGHGDHHDLDPRLPRPDDRTRARPRPQALPGPGHHRRGPAHGGARRLGGDHRPAVGPAGPAHLDGQPPVDADGLHPLLRRAAAARRPHRRLLRAQADVRHQPGRLRRCLRPGRPGPELGHALQRPCPAGSVRRGHGARRAVAAHRGLHRAQGAGTCLRRLRRHRRRRRRHRPHPRRLPDRVRLVALDPPDQRADRHRGRRGRVPLRLARAGPRPTTATTSPVP